MFCEDFSNPTHLSSETNWIFPIINNFYGVEINGDINEVASSYVSKMLPIKVNFSSGSKVMFQTDCSLKSKSNCISLKLYDENFEELSINEPVIERVKYTTHEIYTYTITGDDIHKAKYYKIYVNCCINSLKIYGL